MQKRWWPIADTERFDGSLRWVAVHGLVRRDATGTPTGMLGTAVDFTMRRRADEEGARALNALGERVKELTALHAVAASSRTSTLGRARCSSASPTCSRPPGSTRTSRPRGWRSTARHHARARPAGE